MIPDNIDFLAYKANERWENLKLSHEVDREELLESCTPSFSDYFAEDKSNWTLNNNEIGNGNDWFYFAYPDVAHWFQNSYEEIINAISLQGVEISRYELKHLRVFRIVIDMYKSIMDEKLELEF